MKELLKTLEEIKEWQMNHVRLARTTEVYKLAEKAQQQLKILNTPVVEQANGQPDDKYYLHVSHRWVIYKKKRPDEDNKVYKTLNADLKVNYTLYSCGRWCTEQGEPEIIGWLDANEDDINEFCECYE